MELIFATNNANKIAEIQASLTGNELTIVTLQQAGILIDIPEPFNTLEENATEKATVIHKLTNKNCFSEDTGLEVNALQGAPGVRSARYAGDEANNENNIALLLHNMINIRDRQAQFKTVIALIINDVEHQFTGICTGEIGYEKIGKNGFGYDAIFTPTGSQKTFAEMDMIEKNTYSHRKKALSKLIHFLNNYNGQA